MRYISAQTDLPIRFLGLSTALANAADLADWLGIKKPVHLLLQLYLPFLWLCSRTILPDVLLCACCTRRQVFAAGWQR
jgi:hypothetical protein